VTATGTAPGAARRRLGALRATLFAIAALLAVDGVALVVIHLTQRDAAGYYASDRFMLHVPGYALTSEQLDLAGGGKRSLAKDASQLHGTLRVAATAGARRPIFVGVAREADADRYLGGVARSEVVDAAGAATRTLTRAGQAPAGPPTGQTIWNASASGQGTRTMTWKIRPGHWTVVVMNADATRGVHADIRVGLKTRLLLWIGLGSLGAALLLAAGTLRAAPRPRWRASSR
jgi:hypothetical protein